MKVCTVSDEMVASANGVSISECLLVKTQDPIVRLQSHIEAEVFKSSCLVLGSDPERTWNCDYAYIKIIEGLMDWFIDQQNAFSNSTLSVSYRLSYRSAQTGNMYTFCDDQTSRLRSDRELLVHECRDW